MLSELADLITRLSDADLHCVVTGGFVRDHIHGLPPKDIDIVVLDSSLYDDAEQLAQKLRDAGIHVEQTLVGEGSEGHESAIDRSDLCLVIKGEFLGYAVDVIKFTYPCATPLEVVAGFDCTLNQCWFDFSTPLQPVRTVGDYPSTEYEFPNKMIRSVHSDRWAKMQAKFPDHEHTSEGFYLHEL